MGSHEISRACLEKHNCSEYYMKTMLAMVREIKDDMKQFTFHMRMDSVDLSEFFPLNTDDDVKRFMDRDDEEWPLRRRGFYHLLYTTVTTQKKKFASGLLHTLFTRSYIANHRWPYPG